MPRADRNVLCPPPYSGALYVELCACRPLASLNADYPIHQRHGGWQFGFLTGPNSRELRQLAWRKEEGRWACPTGPEEFPSMRPGETPAARMTQIEGTLITASCSKDLLASQRLTTV